MTKETQLPKARSGEEPIVQPAANTNSRISKTGFVMQTYASTSWCITGWPTQEYTFRSISSAYDVENIFKERIGNRNGVVFDSESSQLYLIFSSREEASSYLDAIEEYLFRLKELA